MAERGYDVAVVGGGMVGAALALALAQRDFSVVVLEARAPQMEWDDAGYDLRVSAITRASQQLLDNLGVWPTLAADRVTPYEHMHVWDRAGLGEIHFDAADLGAHLHDPAQDLVPQDGREGAEGFHEGTRVKSQGGKVRAADTGCHHLQPDPVRSGQNGLRQVPEAETAEAPVGDGRGDTAQGFPEEVPGNAQVEADRLHFSTVRIRGSIRAKRECRKGAQVLSIEGGTEGRRKCAGSARRRPPGPSHPPTRSFPPRRTALPGAE